LWPFGLLKDEAVNRKQRIREDSRQNDVGDEWQDNGNSEDCDDGEGNPEKDAFLFQLSLP